MPLVLVVLVLLVSLSLPLDDEEEELEEELEERRRFLLPFFSGTVNAKAACAAVPDFFNSDLLRRSAGISEGSKNLFFACKKKSDYSEWQ